MSNPTEKFRCSYSLEELKLILSFLQSDPELMLEKIDMYQRTEKLVKKVEAGILGAAFQTTGTAGTSGKIGVLTSQVVAARASSLLQKKEAGQSLEIAELEELVTFKADQKLELDPEEQQVFNSLMMKKMGF